MTPQSLALLRNKYFESIKDTLTHHHVLLHCLSTSPEIAE